MNDVSIGCYSRPLDGRRLCVPSEWARVFQGRGGVVVVALPDGRLVLATKEILEKSSNTELLKAVHCKMDSRGRITIPKVFRGMFKDVKNVVLCGSIHYVEIRRK
jgi:DNA-binding transcriptional regulator/RsmH inhibitor MraZ